MTLPRIAPQPAADWFVPQLFGKDRPSNMPRNGRLAELIRSEMHESVHLGRCRLVEAASVQQRVDWLRQAAS